MPPMITLLLFPLGAVLSLVLTAYAWRRRSVPGARALLLLLVAVAIWSVAYTAELAGADLPTKLLWAKLAYLGIVLVPPAWLLFALHYSGQPRWRRHRGLPLLGLLPLITVLLAWTNEAHGLLWRRVGLQATDGLLLLEVAYGPWFWVHVASSYLLLLLGTVMLITMLVCSPRQYQRQAGALLLAVAAPWLANAVYIFRLTPAPSLDLTPVAFALSGLALGWSLFRFRWLDLFVGLIPLARDAVIDGMRDGIIVLDQHHRIVDVNPAAQQLIGRPAAAILGQPATQVLVTWPAAVLGEDTAEHHAELILGEAPAERSYDLRISPLQYQDGRLAGRLMVVRENTDRKRAEQQQRFLAEAGEVLARSLDPATTLATVARLAVPALADWCTIDLAEDDGTIRRVAAVHAQPAKDALMQQVQARPPDPAGWHPLLAVLRSGQPVLYETVPADLLAAGAHDDEHAHLVQALGITSCIIVPMRARDRLLGTITLVLGDSGRRYDRTELALAEELARRAALALDNARLYQAAQEALELRDHFLSIAAHELRTPVTNVKGYVQLVLRRQREGHLDPDQLSEVLAPISRATDRLVVLTTDLLDVSRLRLGHLPLRIQPTDLATLARVLAAAYQGRLKTQQRLVVETPSTPCPVLADPGRLEQVLTNLLDNAVKYSPAGGTICLTVAPEADGVRLRVQDQGMGLPPGAAETIFEPFNRAANAERAAVPGLGLGLHICRLIVERHGGRIWAESPGEGQGTSVTVWLPARTAPGDPSGVDGQV